MISYFKPTRGASQEPTHQGGTTAPPRGQVTHPRRLWIVDATLVASYAAIAVALGVLSREPPHVTPLWSILVLTALGFLIIKIRRRSPIWAFAAAMTLSLCSFAYGTGAEGFLVAVSLYCAGVTRSARFAWASFAISLLFAAIGAAVLAFRIRFGPSLWGATIPTNDRDSLLDWFNCFVVIAVGALIVALIGMNLGHRRRYVGALVHRAEQMERERDQQAVISVARERERIAREMHDVIAHSLSVMIAMADGASAATTQRPDEAKRAINRVAETGRRTLDEVRRLLGNVRGEDESQFADHTPQPDAAQLPALVAEFVEAGLPVRFEMAGAPSDDPALGLTVYRIVQESLTNVLRHGRNVRDVTVQTSWSKDHVEIIVDDTSSPAVDAPSFGRGILGMRERAALYDGVVEAGPLDAGGWRVFVRLQCEEP